ncbi:MAG TPA: DHA2 family efflux MFS transporter permease subunit [Steroidobacteraceae bacterium]|jgi:EmrB/QacA subfamily drug resistance transporter
MPCDPGVIRGTQHCEIAHGLSSTRKRLVLAATVLGSSLAFIDGSVVNIALPVIQGALHASTVQMQWIVNAYLLMLGALVLIGGATGDRYGRRLIFVAGIVVFTGASVACALADGAGMLIGARALQGVGAAMLVPGSLAILGSTFAPSERGAAVGAWAGFAALAAAAGPVLGGWLVDTISWRAIFLINVPLAAITIWLAFVAVPESKDANAQGIDWRGALLVATGLGVLSFGLTAASERGLGDPRIIVAIVVGIALLGAFLVAEHRARAPMMPLDLYRSGDFSGTNLLTLLLYFAMGGVFFILPFELIRLNGYSATAAGAALLPFSFVMGTLSGTAGKLADRFGPRLSLTLGPMLAAVGLVAMTLPAPGQSYWTGLGPAILVVAVGMTMAVAPLTSTVMSSVPDGREGLASGINNAVARVAGLLAVAIMSLVFARVFISHNTGVPAADSQQALVNALSGGGSIDQHSRTAFHTAFRAVMLGAATCAALGGLAAGVMVRRRKPA